MLEREHQLDFIERVTTRNWKSVDVGKRVAVIGGGNTAIDAATEAKRLGAEQVMIIYRRSRNEMPAYKHEYELAKSDDVSFHFLTAPKRILGRGHVAAVECIRMKLSTPDAQGRRKPEPIPNSEFQIPVDMVIKSVGQNIARSFLSSNPDLRIEADRIWVHPDTFQTSKPNLFAGGDCINGGKEVVNAASDGKKAAHAIDKYLFSK